MAIFNTTEALQVFQNVLVDGPCVLSNTVGLDGVNNANDVRALQNRLINLGFLSQNELGQEYPGTGVITQIADTSLEQTIGAISDFTRMALGIRLVQIRPKSTELKFLNMNRPRRGEISHIALSGDVGGVIPNITNATNNLTDVELVRNRLRVLGFLPLDSPNNMDTLTNAIKDFNFKMVMGSFNRIRPNSPELEVLNKPPRFRPSLINLENEVGEITNNPAGNKNTDVAAVQTRLNELGYLSTSDFNNELVSVTGTSTINVSQIPKTIVALKEFKIIRGFTSLAAGIIAPRSSALRILSNPLLPNSKGIFIQDSVGSTRRGTVPQNNRADVRVIQDRLHELGFLKPEHYVREKVSSIGTPATINQSSIPRTREALREFQANASLNVPTGIIELNTPNSNDRLMNNTTIWETIVGTVFALFDPTYGSGTYVNPNALNPMATAPTGDLTPDQERIYTAIIRSESDGNGEIPARLRNGSYTPTSFGKVQTIGSTALSHIISDTVLRNYYGLDSDELSLVNGIARDTESIYFRIEDIVLDEDDGAVDATLYDRVVNILTSEAISTPIYNRAVIRLTNERISQDTTYWNAFSLVTGLDIVYLSNMIEVNILRKMLTINTAAQIYGRGGAANTPGSYFNYITNLLGLRRSDVNLYSQSPSQQGEIRNGFVTKSILSSSIGQNIRNAMTDNSGLAIGKLVVRSTFNSVRTEYNTNAQTQQIVDQYISENPTYLNNILDADAVIAACTARRHNGGGTSQERLRNLGGQGGVLNNGYVRGVMRNWYNSRN
ncbi:peptidoglycan-binding domain-containing protein [Sporocytophaga myxococcoides]|uniref:peptidoglycan-binding domain-containing protein n=1 Tax=Sporocytophaga myxococcoides TaxID=153721 RepID=UPI000426102E|nr:peptidoglycan-binding domain-containing protein [Sporocytophaga myxococcoides]